MEVLRWDGESVSRSPDELAVEEPLEIRVRGRAVSVTMRTPGHDDELAAGFLLTEGIIRARGDVLRIEPCGRERGRERRQRRARAGGHVDFERLTRHVFASSSCGLCGKATIDAVRAQFPPVESDVPIDARGARALPEKMRAAQATFDRTGGLHAAALFDAGGRADRRSARTSAGTTRSTRCSATAC